MAVRRASILALSLAVVAPVAFIIVGTGCARVTSGEWLRVSAVPVYAGYNGGGVIENMDAVTCATRPMYSAGVGIEFEVKGHPIEVGLGWHAFDQTFSPPHVNVYQHRDVRFSQVRVPLTYNLDLVRSGCGFPLLGLKLGLSAGYTALLDVKDRGGSSPPYTFNRFDIGPVLGLTWHPVRFGSNALGLFVDMYRGSVIYEDGWASADGYGNQSILRAGLAFRALER